MASSHQELFLRVATQRLDRLEGLLERLPEEAALAELRRELHTLKGEANVIGRRDVGRLVHLLEDAFGPSALPRDEASWARRLDLALETSDLLRVGLGDPEELEQGRGPLEAILSELAPARGAAGPQALEAPLPLRSEPAQAEASAAASARSLSIGELRLDLLAEGVERTTLARARIGSSSRQLLKTLTSLRDAYDGQPWLKELLGSARQLSEDSFALDQSVQQLSEVVRELRLSPIQGLFLDFRRPIRELSRRLGKEVGLSLEAGQAELDHALVELLREPLLHLIQNALDHGLEPGEEREAAGKPRAGSLALRAWQEGTRVRLSVGDDGRGLDPTRLREQARAVGLLSAAQAERLSDVDALDLAFSAGLSTAERVSDISGRGVGLDVVRARVEQHRGRVWVESELGRGTTFHLDVPISLLLAPALHVEVSGNAYALGVDQVERVTLLEEERIHSMAGRPAYSLDGETLVPLVDLAAAVPGAAPSRPGSPLVIVSSPRRLALAVEKVLGQIEVVFRPLDAFMSGIGTARSSCVLPDGRAALLLAPEALSRRRARELSEDARPQARTILVADDSPVTRELLVEIVRSAGFRVLSAEDGQAALRTLSTSPADLLLTDLEMPILDGIGLTRAVRADPDLHDLPVVLITTRGSDADRRACLGAGADAFLDKSRFDEGALIELLKRLLA